MNNLIDATVQGADGRTILAERLRRLMARLAPNESAPVSGAAITLVVQSSKIRRTPINRPGREQFRPFSGTASRGSQVIYFLEAKDGSEIRMVVQELFGVSKRCRRGP
jgi:hypothetical protein